MKFGWGAFVPLLKQTFNEWLEDKAPQLGAALVQIDSRRMGRLQVSESAPRVAEMRGCEIATPHAQENRIVYVSSS